MRDLVRARTAAVETLWVHRQQISAFMSACLHLPAEAGSSLDGPARSDLLRSGFECHRCLGCEDGECICRCSTLKHDETAWPLHIQQGSQFRAHLDARKGVGHSSEPLVSVSRSI